MPSTAAAHQYSDLYTGNTEHIETNRDKLKQIINSIEWDRFDLDKFEEASQLADDIFGDKVNVMSVLWENGLLGYTDNSNKTVFYSNDPWNEFNIPADKQEYVLHPCLIDAIGVKTKGIPVIHFNND
jgi:hypothetical protein